MNNHDAIKGSELYLRNHGFDLGKLSQCSSADEIDAIISSTVSKKDAPLFKAIINKSFVPNDDGSFKPFYETNPRTAGDSAEWFDFFRSYGNGTELKKEVHFDLSNHKGRKMNFLGYDEEITNDFRASDLVQQGKDSNIHIENKVGVWGNNLRPRIRQELYADALRMDNDPTSKQEYRIYVNAANGKCLFDDSEQASYLKTMLERYPDRCTVKFNDIKLSPNDIETIISKKERGVLAKDICQKVLVNPAKEISGFQKSSLGRASSHTVKLFGGIGAMKSASGSSVNWGKIITSIIAVLVVLALIVGVVVLLAKVLPPVFEAIGQFFVNLWNGICNFFGAIGRFFVNLWNGICDFFKGLFAIYKLEFDTTDNGKTYFVSEYKVTFWGWLSKLSFFIWTPNEHQVEIPETYNGVPVVGIGENAFAGDVYLVELHIPSSIEWIEVNAFNGCEVKELYIEDIESWVKIDFRRAENEADGACYSHPFNYFDNRTKGYTNINFIYLNGERIHELVIPSSVTEISDYAFYNFTGIDKFVIHDGVSKIGENAFARNYIRDEYHMTETKPYEGYWDITFDGTMSKWREITEDMAFSANQGVYCDDGMVAYDYYCYSDFELDYYYDDLREIIEDYWN